LDSFLPKEEDTNDDFPFPRLSRLKHLQSISLAIHDWDDIKKLDKLPLTGLRIEIALSDHWNKPDVERVSTALRNFSSLTRLKLEGDTRVITRDLLQTLNGLNLQKLQLVYHDCCAGGDVDIDWASSFSRLKILKIENADVEFSTFFPSLPPSLRHLTLNYSFWGGSDYPTDLTKPPPISVEDLKQITKLSLSWGYRCMRVDPVYPRFIGFHGLFQLRILELRCMNVVLEEELKNLNQLEELRVTWGPRVTNWTWLRGLTQLQILCIWNVGFENTSLLPCLPMLRVLSLAGLKITDDWVKSLPLMPQVTRLDVSRCKLLSYQCLLNWKTQFPKLAYFNDLTDQALTDESRISKALILFYTPVRI